MIDRRTSFITSYSVAAKALLAALALLAAAPRTEAAYAKTDCIWKCDFTPEEAVRYKVFDKLEKSRGGTAEIISGGGETGDGAIWFRGPARVFFPPDVEIKGRVQLEVRIMGLNVQRLPDAKSFCGPTICIPYTIRDKEGKPKKIWTGTSQTFGSFAWTTWLKVTDVPAEAEDLYFQLGLEETTGELWIDSVSVWRVEEVPDEKVEAPFNAEAATLPRGRFADSPNPDARRGVSFTLSKKPGKPKEAIDDSGEYDMARLESWGANMARVWVQPRGWETEEEYFNKLGACVDYAGRMLDAAARHGIKVAVALGSCPGWTNSREQSLVATKDFQSEMLAKVWMILAARFVGHPALYGYDILNEPGMRPADWNRVFEDAVAAIRKVDSATPVITESLSRYWPQGMNVIYSIHPYQPHDLTHQAIGGRNTIAWSYPGYINGVYWDKEQMRLARKQVIEFQQAHPDARIFVGEFSCILWAKGAEKWIADSIDLFEEYGWDWCYHAYSEWPPWDVEYTHDEAYTPGKFIRATEDTDRKKVLLRGFSRNQKKQ